MNDKQVQYYKEAYPKGTRIMLIHDRNDNGRFYDKYKPRCRF